MVTNNDPYGLNKEKDIESNIAVWCDNCRHFSGLPYYYDKDLDIEIETAKIKHQHKDNNRILYQCDLIPGIYKKYRRHPTSIITALKSSFWSAWDYDVANYNGIQYLIGRCRTCDKMLEDERLTVIENIIQNEIKKDK